MKVIAFDLDDTLYKEVDFLRSAYREISTYLSYNFGIEDTFDLMIQFYDNGKNVFEEIKNRYCLTVSRDTLLEIYRNHFPDISLNVDISQTLESLRERFCQIALITDGRTITQKNKIKALGLQKYLNESLVIISEEFGSEKPANKNYLYIQNSFPNADFFYVGDNLKKDFITANFLGWTTICLLDNGLNIHKQDFNLSVEYLPKYTVTSLFEILNII